MRRTLALAIALIGLSAPAGAREMPPEHACAQATGTIERAKAVPPRLLHAISIVESGRFDKERQASSAWPWTINAEGSGQFFPTKDEAIAAVRKLQARGVRSIDVGCMQVNLMHHPKAFDSLEAAFDPMTNVAYAAEFLADLKDANQSWDKAIAHYHSATPERGEPYRQRVVAAWGREPPAPLATRPVRFARADLHLPTRPFTAASLAPQPLAQSRFAPLPARRTALAPQPVPPAKVYAYTSTLVRPEAWRVR